MKLDRKDARVKKTLESTIVPISARSYVPWLPNVSSTSGNSKAAFSVLGESFVGE